MAVCEVCFRKCHIEEGQTGFCGARGCRDGKVVPESYARLTSLALDPIEKKPLYHFYPGSRILSVGSYGCNLRCPFCQNYEISLADVCDEYTAENIRNNDNPDENIEITIEDYQKNDTPNYETYTPEELCALAVQYRAKGNLGIAYTYNEPLVSYEFVRDTAKLVHEAGMKNVLVSAGTADPWVLEELLPYIDAMNIDLKSWSADIYRRVLRGDLTSTLRFIEKAAAFVHVEVTTLIVPEMNDSEEEIRAIASWIASLNGGKGREIPYHVTRFFPRNRMSDVPPTAVETVYRLAGVAGEVLDHVYTGNC